MASAHASHSIMFTLFVSGYVHDLVCGHVLAGTKNWLAVFVCVWRDLVGGMADCSRGIGLEGCLWEDSHGPLLAGGDFDSAGAQVMGMATTTFPSAAVGSGCVSQHAAR